ncbi:MAG: VCBS repeat-containing protein, partial [Cytophagales bacterium]|nr:VCBS repeat-containing protein [Cytophaga sp.]
MGANRANSKAILLDNGKVLAYGLGDFTSAANTKLIELYDPSTGTWSGQVYHTIGTQGYNINRLANGKILISGGSNTVANGATTACFLIDQTIGGCSPAPNLSMFATGTAACFGKGSSVTLSSTESGVIYKIQTGANTIATAAGTGSTLTIPINESYIQANTNVYTIYVAKAGCNWYALADTAIVKSVITVSKPVITSPGVSFCAGDSLKLSAPAGFVSYNWSTKATSEFIYVKNAGDYAVEVTQSGGCKSLPSNLLIITTNPVLPTSVLITASKNPIVAGDLATFTATSINPGTAPVYEWRVNNIVTGGSSNVFSSTTINNGDIITCTLTSNALCAKPQSDPSNSIEMIVTPYVDYPRVISTSPASNAVNISNKQDIAITFSKVMSFSTNGIDTLIRIFGSYSGSIKGTYTGNGTNTIVFTPSQYSNPGEKISVLIDSTFKDNTGIALKSGYTFELTVAATPSTGDFVDGSEIADLKNPVKIIPADFDNDQQMDFISYSNSPAGIQIWMNQGNGTYNSSQSITTQYDISEISVADLNNDGHIDIYITYLNSSTLTVWLNNNLVFSKKEFAIKYNSYKTFAGDFDGDADIDIAIKSNSSAHMIIQKNDGHGNFNNGDYVLNAPCNNFKAGDFDNDGDLDFIISSSTMQFLQNNGKSVFTAISIPLPVLLTPYPYSEIVSMGDYDNNGFLDMIVQLEKTIGVIKNAGNGNFLAYDSIGNFLRGAQNTIKDYPSADFDGDGDLDFGYTNWKTFSDPPNDSIDIWTNNSNGKFTLTKRSLVGANTGIYNLIPMDIDGDGDIDIAYVNRYLRTTFLKLNGGTKTTISIIPPNTNQLCASNPMSISLKKTGAFNSGNIFKLQLSDKNGTFAAPTEIGSTSNNSILSMPALIPSSVQDGTKYRIRIISSDPLLISNDNGFDITIRSNCNILKSITPLENVHNVSSSQIIIANFSQEPELPTSGTSIYGSFSGSYLNKGIISKSGNSLIFTPTNYFAGEEITITLDSSIKSISGQKLVNPSTSTFTVGSDIAPALFTAYKPIDSTNMNNIQYLATVGDLNNDEKIDVITRDGATGDINVFFNKGDGSYDEKKSLYNLMSSSTGVNLLDFDNDGDLDMALHIGLGNISILKNDGLADFTLIQTIPATCYYLKLGDINNDGFIDIVSTSNNATMDIFLNDKASHFNYFSTIQLQEYVSAISLNDMDNDGDIDILYGSATATNLYLLDNVNSGITFKKRIISNDFWGAQIVVVDLNNDKLLDIAGSTKILFNDSNNSFLASKAINFGQTLSNINAADFNGDNNMDLFFQSSNDYNIISIMLGDGAGNFPVLRKIKDLVFALPADVDNDGDVDLVGFTNILGLSVRSFINDVSLKTQAVSLNKFCTENSINVTFVRKGIPDNIPFLIQLSDPTGNFISSQIIGTGMSSPISCTIPSTTQSGNKYRIRVISDSLNLIGTNNGTDLTVTINCPTIRSLSPAPNDHTAAPTSSITATFTSDMLASSVTAGTFRVFKNYSGFDSDKGVFSLSDPKSIIFNPNQNYFAGEKVSVTLTKQVQNTDQTPLTPFVYNFNVQPQASSGSFYMKDDVFTNLNQQQMAVKSADFD